MKLKTRKFDWRNNEITRQRNDLFMENVFDECNKSFLIGTVEKEFEFSHETKGIKFFRTRLIVERLSGTKDFVPLVVTETILKQENLYGVVRKRLIVLGQFRSYNWEDEKQETHLKLFMYAKKVSIYGEYAKDELMLNIKDIDVMNNNLTFLDGFICKKPEIRVTPFGREISNLLIAVNRRFGKSDYFPCIAWEKTAEWAEGLEVGDRVQLYARMQSREYYKRFSPDSELGEMREAYELSIIEMRD